MEVEIYVETKAEFKAHMHQRRIKEAKKESWKRKNGIQEEDNKNELSK